MQNQQTDSNVLAVVDLRDYFRESISSVIDKQGVAVDPHAAHYVVNLLTLFSRSEELYEEHDDVYGLRPLAVMMAHASDARSPQERSCSLQRIGDVALFIAGFFADSLATKVVDLDYYIAMGGSAYGSLSDEMNGSTRGMVFAGIYRELAEKFQVIVDVLNEVRDATLQESDHDLLRTYEVWLKTGSRRAAGLLRQNGVITVSGAVFGRRH